LIFSKDSERRRKTDSGIFISFEGIDGSGKSTHLRIAADFLARNGFVVTKTREPGGTKLAERIRDVLLDNQLSGGVTPMAELLLYLASRHQHCEEIITPRLSAGETVLTDRFADSSTAYQGGGRGIGLELVEQLNELVIPRWPDLTIFIDVPVEIALARTTSRELDRLEEEGIDFMRAVRRAYIEISQKHRERFVTIDGSKDIAQTAERIEVVLTEFLARKTESGGS